MSRMTIDFVGLQLIDVGSAGATIYALQDAGHVSGVAIPIDSIDFASSSAGIPFQRVVGAPGGALYGILATSGQTVTISNGKWGTSGFSKNVKAVPSLSTIEGTPDSLIASPTYATRIDLDHGSLSDGGVIQGSGGGSVDFYFRSKNEANASQKGIHYPQLAPTAHWESSLNCGIFTLAVGAVSIVFLLDDNIAVVVFNTPTAPDPAAEHFSMYYDMVKNGSGLGSDDRRIPVRASAGGGTVKCFVATVA